MAPENPPGLVVFDSRIENDVLVGSIEYIEPIGADQQFRVRWAVEKKPIDFDPVGDGVAYIYSKGPKVDVVPISEDARPTLLGDSRYQWTEGLQFGRPWLMFILILPEGYSIDKPDPKPAGTKNFKGRLALYWILRGDDLGRTKVEWDLLQLKGSIDTDLKRVNKSYLAGEAIIASTITVEDPQAEKQPQIKEVVLGNKYTFGDISGSIVNVDSVLNQVTQNVGSSSNVDEAAKKDLTELIEKLRIELQNAPPTIKEGAEAVAHSASALIEVGTKAEPNNTTVEITADGLKKAAENIASVMPSVLTIASSIVKTVYQLSGFPMP